ncbi:MAG TPA: amylo-alpha-1,6-glucosidase [Burkholderiaceae bacterium]|nr:amylo-alpha-1,6-glucosidase [Burkholderiaceae bacterium]
MNELSRIQVEGRWYVLATSARVEGQLQTLKRDDLFALFDRFGDILPWEGGEQGLYAQDTRFLSHLELLLDGVRPLHLNTAVKEDGCALIVELMNPDLQRDGRVLARKGSVHVLRRKLLWDGACHEQVRFTHHGTTSIELQIELRVDADFIDVFELRGVPRARRGQRDEPTGDATTQVFAYRGLDERRRRTLITFDTPALDAAPGVARFALRLQPGEQRSLRWQIACETPEAAAPATISHDDAWHRHEAHVQRSRSGRCRVASSNPMMNRWLERSASDLDMLTTALPSGPFPYAGVPWYSTTFGRDALLTAYQSLWLRPDLARGVLAFLAATQATENDAATDAEPGKILHEARNSEMAATREVPFRRYYGSVDATPLFVVLAAAYWRRTADLEFIRTLWPHVSAALQWIARDGDRDGDGFVEYARRSGDGLVQQGWKDSQDSVFHADGRMAPAPIALCEVQGYVYAAQRGAAELAVALGDLATAARCIEQAQELKRRFQQHFWCDEIGLYALALDGDKQPCRVASSNAGHALWAGIAAPEHAERIARRVLERDMFSGWGVRTLASGQAHYNPMSYHNGSVWPHDNALICEGLARYGQVEAALALLRVAFDSTQHFEGSRLPELYCGFQRRDGEGPTRYPVACSPQAWASAAAFGMIAGCLGLEFDASRRRLRLRSPRLPGFVDWLRIERLRVADAQVDLLLQRYRESVGVNVTQRTGDVEVSALV